MLIRFRLASTAATRLGTTLRLAWRNVLRQRARSTTALIAAALGVAAMIIAGGFVADVYVQFGEAIIHSQYGHVQIHRLGFMNEGTQRPAAYIIDVPAGTIAIAASLPVTQQVMSRLRFAGVANAGGADLPIIGEGVEPSPERELGSSVRIVGGRPLRTDDTDVVIIGAGVAKALQLDPGDRLNISIVSREGALNSLPFEVAGVFRSYSKDFDERAIRLPLRSAQELMATDGINEIVVQLRDTSATDSAAAQLRAQLEPGEYEVHTWRDLADFYTKTVQLFDREFGFLRMILLLLIMLSVWNTIYTSAFERLPEFGTMLALGDRRQDVFLLIMVESVVLGVIGSGLGVAIGVVLASLLSTIGIPMPAPPNADLGYTALIRIGPPLLASSFVIGTLAASLAGIAPSTRIARTKPVDALRRAR